MADVSKIAANGTTYNIKDEEARSRLDGLFMQSTNWISAHSSHNYDIEVSVNEMGIIIIGGAADTAKEIIIYFSQTGGTVTYKKVIGANLIAVSTSTRTLTITNNLDGPIRAMQIKG